MVGQVHDVLYLHFNIKHKLQVLKLKIELSRKFEDDNREESRAKLTISKFGEVPEEGLEESLRAKSMNVCLLRRNLKEAFEGVVNATGELNFMAKDFKTSLETWIGHHQVNIDKTFEGKYFELDSKLTSIYKLERLGENFEKLDPDSDLDQLRAHHRKLIKADIAAELNNFEDGNREEGNAGKMVEGMELAFISARTEDEGTLGNEYCK